MQSSSEVIESNFLYTILDKVREAVTSCTATDDPHTGSDATFRLMSAWVAECLEKHEICRKTQPESTPLPTRVLDVGPPDGSQQPFLYQPDRQERGHYIALSHCWGKHELLRTLKDTLLKHKREIPMSAMGKTFADSVIVTRKLHVRYLWIDSLCIIQDDPNDWEKEAICMCDVYQNALLTIAAAHATDGTVGLFVSRDPLATRPCELPIQHHGISDGEHRPIFACVDKMSYTWAMRVKTTPLHRRAWVFQEQLLSNRTLSFENDSVTWRCQSMRFYEKNPLSQELYVFITERKEKQSSWKGDPRDADAHIAELQSRWITSPISSSNQSLPISVASNRTKTEWDSLVLAWARIVEEFTERQLTYISDRLAAIRGVSDALSRSVKYNCIAGIWPVSLYKGLLWCTWQPRRRTGLAPTWSWASVDGEIRWPGLWSHHTQRLATILDVKESGTGSRSSGSITLEADVRPGVVGVRDADGSRRIFLAWRSSAYDKAPSWDLDEETEGSAAVTPDVDKLGTPVSTDVELPPPHTPVWFAVIAHGTLHGQNRDRSFIYTLLLQDTGLNSGEFQRIGFASWEEENWKEPLSRSSEAQNVGKHLPMPKKVKVTIV